MRRPVDAFGEQVLAEFGGCLGFGDPVRRQSRLLDRAARLRPAGDDLRLRERGVQFVEETRFVGRLHPAAEADSRSMRRRPPEGSR